MSTDDCTLIIPASGFSVRFGEHDKLLADFNGSPLAAYAAQRAVDAGFTKMIAVVPKNHHARAQIFASRGFQLVENTAPELGQANSIQLGFDAIDKPVKAVCIMLADMPLVPPSHIHALVTAAPENGVIKTLYEGYTQPPAVFTGTALQKWIGSGRTGNSSNGLALTEVLQLEAPLGADVDTPKDLELLSATV